jgi:AraC-like DNA-binding protein
MNINFHEFKEPNIRDLVRAVFQTDGFHDFKNEIIMPKGTTEIIFDLSETTTITARLGEGKQVAETLPRCFVYSFTKQPTYVDLPSHQTYFGISLNPLVIKDIFGIPAGEFANRWIDMSLIDRSISSLWEQLCEQSTFSSRVSVVGKWIQKKIKPIQKQEQLLYNFLGNPILASTSVPQLAELLCYSPRHLSRKFQHATGMNTEEILAYKKYSHALHLIHNTSLSLTEIAYQSHFTDQSHFIKSFKAFTEMTPGKYSQLMTVNPPGHIFQNVR